ncbi:MAG: threonine--tRNA ligase, partial [Dermabacter sp.]|nr:threonine--tRNA ligase [Dermabacter sp.]
SQLSIVLDGSPTTIEQGTTGETLYEGRREIVALRINGELKDLYIAPAEGDTVEGVDIASEDGLNILRHSCAHVLAQAVQRRDGNAKLGIGPFITDGFYYDFDVAEPFTPEDLKAIEKDMQRIVKEGQRFQRRDIDDADAREEEKDEPYKLELIGLKSNADTAAEGASVEVGDGGLTMYDNVNKKGEVVWTDLCRGPHLPSTRLIGNGFSLMRSAAAYWRGSEKNPMLQRIYGTAWATKDDLKAYKFRLEEAQKRDHRKLGSELDLFSFPDEIGSGLAVFHPKGAMVRMEMENYSRQRHVEAGYDFVYTPHATKGQLFETSGHLDWYRDGMYPPMHLDEERDAEGNVTKQGQDYYLKPMNCPMHN